MISLALAGASAARAQEAWVQIEAQPNRPAAEERAKAYANLFPNVAGFRMTTGWYAIALGPFTPEEAARQLDLLKGERLIPGDSYLTRGERFRDRYWPAEGTPAVTPTQPEPEAAADPAPEAQPAPEPETAAAPEPAPQPQPTAEPEETLAQARAAEAQLDADQRKLIQAALQWEGHYSAAIDGAFGPGTRASMAGWQAAMGHEPTGVLTTTQRDALVGGYQEMLGSLGLAAVTEDEAGISITLPLALVDFTRYEPPFVHFDARNGSGVQVILISQQGDQNSLAGLYDLLQTLTVLPLDGPREKTRTGFTIEGSNASHQSYAQAELKGGLIKGFVLAWPAGDDRRFTRVRDAMKASFRAEGTTVLDEALGVASTESAGALMAGLEVRKPKFSRSGFYVSAKGEVLTTVEAVAGCGRITLDGATEATVELSDADLGIALLKPAVTLAPPAVATFRAGSPRPLSEVAVSGFSYDALTAPVLTFGRFAEAQGLDGDATLARLTLAPRAGDAGGAVIDGAGTVIGMLLPRQTDGQVLPDDVAFARSAAAIAARLTEAGHPPLTAAAETALAPEDLTRRGRDIAVQVSCWE